MATVYLSLGTNLGDKSRNIRTATELLAERVGGIRALSSFYDTKPWGFESEHSFLNAALVIETFLGPFELLNATQSIETAMGRSGKSNGTYADRLIDIDILMYEDLVLSSKDLILPHPLMHERSFVLVPLAEIAASLLHPVLKKTIKELCKETEV